MGAGRVVRPGLPGEEGGELHEARALLRVAVLAPGQHRHEVGRAWTVGDGWVLGIIMTGSVGAECRARGLSCTTLLVSKRPNTLASQDLRRDRPVNAGVAPPLHGTLAPWRGRRVGGGCRGARSWPGPGWRRWRPVRWPSTRECCPAGPRCSGTGSRPRRHHGRRRRGSAGRRWAHACRAASCRRRAGGRRCGWTIAMPPSYGSARGRRCRWPSCCTAAAGTTPRRSTTGTSASTGPGAASARARRLRMPLDGGGPTGTDGGPRRGQVGERCRCCEHVSRAARRGWLAVSRPTRTA